MTTMIPIRYAAGVKFDLVFEERVRNGPYEYSAKEMRGDAASTAVVKTTAWWNGGEVLLVQHCVSTREPLAASTDWTDRRYVALHKVEAVDPTPVDCVVQPGMGAAVRLALKVHEAMRDEVFACTKGLDAKARTR